MAVQKSKKSRARRDMRRSHDGTKAPAYSVDKITGEVHRRHNLTPTGYYRGKQVVNIKVKDKDRGSQADEAGEENSETPQQ